MAQSAPSQKLVTPVSLVIDLILVIAFFVFMFGALKSHVPSNDSKMVALWAAIGTSCLTGVFWLALQMFRVVLSAQRASRRH